MNSSFLPFYLPIMSPHEIKSSKLDNNEKYLNHSIQQPYALKLDTNRTNAFANSFIPMTSRDWNSLPLTVFPATYNLQSFKIRIYRFIQLRPNPWNLFLFSQYKQGSIADYRGCTFLVQLLLVSISL